MKIVTHIKTGDTYIVECESRVNATNGEHEGNLMVDYQNLAGDMFTREYVEFWKKFKNKI